MAKQKNADQRKRLKAQNVTFCRSGHPLIRALFVAVKGPKRFIWTCECELSPMQMR